MTWGRRTETLTSVEAEQLALNLAELARTGLPLNDGLRAAAGEVPAPRVSRALNSLADVLESGNDLNSATLQQRDQLPKYLRGYIAAAAWSGHYTTGTQEENGPIRSVDSGYHHNWIGQILPYMERDNAYRHIDFDVGVYHKNNRPVRQLAIELLNCPTSGSASQVSDYAGVHHDVEAPIDVTNNGVFYLNSRTTYEDVSDGSSQTFFIGEKSYPNKRDLGWMSGTRATLRNTGTAINSHSRDEFGDTDDHWDGQDDFDDGFSYEGYSDGGSDPYAFEGEDNQLADDNDDTATEDKAEANLDDVRADELAEQLHVGGFGSMHPGGVQFAMGDGSVRAISNSISFKVYQQLGHRSDGQLLSDDSY